MHEGVKNLQRNGAKRGGVNFSGEGEVGRVSGRRKMVSQKCVGSLRSRQTLSAESMASLRMVPN